MKLSVKEVRERGPLDLEEVLAAELIPLDAQNHQILTAPVRMNVHAEALGDEILALIKAETRASLECSRCLEVFGRPLEARLELHVPMKGTEVELDEEIRQSFLLALPVKPLCRPDCKGLCTHCGKNLNQGPCGCPSEREESPFAALKNLKPR
jgi:uncharacterized protein